MNLLQRRVLIVTGKGGVGKTTMSASIGMAAAQQGARCLIVETAGAQRIAPIFGMRSKGYSVLELQPNLFTLSITPREAIEDYVVQQLHFRRLYKLIFENRVMGPFINAVPGLHDAVQLGKVWDLERQTQNGRPEWDLIIVDAPATGHGLTLLDSPSAMCELTRSGPMYRAVKMVEDLVTDPEKTSLVLVTLPEPIPVSETVELIQKLPDGMRQQIAMIGLNECWDTRNANAETVQSHADPKNLPRQQAIRLWKEWKERTVLQEQAQVQLRDHISVPIAPIPFLLDRELDPQKLHRLSLSLTPFVERERPS